jgi:uncharacterized protein with HEPN domain
MKPPEIRKYLFDIWQACELLAQFFTGKTLNDYQGDALLRSAIERQFEIVGEALNQAIKLNPELANQVSDSGRIIAFRNRLIHAYAAVSNESSGALLRLICQSCALRYNDSWRWRLTARDGPCLRRFAKNNGRRALKLPIHARV